MPNVSPTTGSSEPRIRAAIAQAAASTGVDFEVSQVVDQVLGVHAMIPKSLFTKKKFAYW